MNNSTRGTFVNTLDRTVEVALSVVNVWVQRAGSVLEWIGNFLSGLLVGFGKVLSGIPAAGRILFGIFRWLGTIVSAGFDVAAMLICAMLNFVATVCAGLVRIFAGLLTVIFRRDGWLARKGLGDILSGSAGAVIAIVAKMLALVQSVIVMQMGERPLNEDEKSILKRVYRNSLSINNIRIIEGFAGLFNVNNRPFTLGNRIYMKDHNSATDPALFVHECCHVWQYQHEGTRYIADALWAQHTFKNAYDWEAEIERGTTRWQDFNKEAQAEFLLDLFNSGHRIPSTSGRGEFFDDDPIEANVIFRHRSKDRTELATQCVNYIRNKKY